MNSYVGNTPTTGHFPTDTFTSSGGSTYTLSQAPATTGSIEVSVQGVLQAVSAYTISGTTLTLAGVASGDVIFVRHLGETLQVPTPGDASVSTAKIVDDAVTTAKILDANVTTAKIAADAIDGTKLADNACNSEHYTDGSIDLAHLSADCVDGTKIADDAINSEHIAAASIDAEHLAVGKDGAFSLDAIPNTDHTAVGPQTTTLSSGYSSTIMDLVYLDSSNQWLEADADATGTSINLLGIALEAKTNAQPMNVALPGSFVRDDSWSWTGGVPLYISNTPGAITATKPTGSGDVVRTVGFAVTGDVIFFNPSSDYVTLA